MYCSVFRYVGVLLTNKYFSVLFGMYLGVVQLNDYCTNSLKTGTVLGSVSYQLTSLKA